MLDLRPALVRRFSRTWDHGHAQPPQPAGPVARLAGRVTDRVVARRVGLRPACPEGPHLVSVGNLAVGGTGKTPVIMALAQALFQRGRRGAILTRGYGSSLKGPVVVTRETGLAGDEARLMAWRLKDTGWPVIQARDRPTALGWLADTYPGLDYVLLEDAHQTPGLARHLDILLLDRWRRAARSRGDILQPATGPVFPFGPWRETAAGADRAGILLVETESDIPAKGPGGQTVAAFSRTLSLMRPEGHPLADVPGSHYALLSGIARPVGFESAVQAKIGRPASLAIRCPDHAAYEPGTLKRIDQALAQAGTRTLCTTLKDWVKLDGQLAADIEVVLVDLTVEWGQARALPHVVEERLGLGR